MSDGKITNSHDQTLVRRDKDYLQAMSPEARKQWLREIIDRMCQVWGAKSRAALAEDLGYNHKAHSNWVKLTSIPHHVIYTCHSETGASLDWIYNGTTTMQSIAVNDKQRLIAKAEEILDMSITMNQMAQLQPGSVNAVATAVVTELIKVIMGTGNNADVTTTFIR